MTTGSVSRRAGVFVARLLLLIALLVYMRWLWPSMEGYAGGADSAGYLWSARLFSEGRLSVAIARPDGFPDSIAASTFAPLGATPRPGHWELVPTYPTGFPLHIAAMRSVLPETLAVLVVMSLVTAGTLWLMYRLGRAVGLDREWAGLAAAILGLSPLFLFLAVQPLSDVAATFWALAVVLAAWSSRRDPRMALLAGAALGVATLVRPTNVVLVAPLLAAMPFTRDRVSRLVGAGAPFVVFLAAYQAWCYGAPWRSGYGDVGSAFEFATASKTLMHYATWLPRLCTWLVVLAPGALLAWRGRLGPWRRIIAAWLAAVLGLYAFYYHTAETWWYLRFVLPGLPALIVAGLAVAQRLARAVAGLAPRRLGVVLRMVALAAIAVAVLASLVRDPLFDQHRDIKAAERVYSQVIHWMTLKGKRSEPMLTSQLGGATLFYGPDVYQLRLDRVSATDWQVLRAWQQRTGRAIDAALLPFEYDDLFVKGKQRLACDWSAYDVYRSVTFWRCPPPAAPR